MVNETGTFNQKLKTQGRIIIPKMVRDGLKFNIGDDLTVTVQKTHKV
jgi:bifunctional DNA-binding transcriptional regulator/antitoxin component of YhaV-PrlF toxin-antitoxin module